MRITVRVKANAKCDRVEKLGEREYALHVKAPAKEGKANKAAIGLLSEYFGRPKSSFSIVLGETSKAKVIEIA